MRKITQPQPCIGPSIRIGRESWCLPYAGFFLMIYILLYFFLLSNFKSCCTLCHLQNHPLKDDSSFDSIYSLQFTNFPATFLKIVFCFSHALITPNQGETL